MSKPRVMVAWSTGKDAAWTLHQLRQAADVEVVGLLTTVNMQAEQVAMHATRLCLLEAQAQAVQLPLRTIAIPWPCTNAAYETAFRAALEQARRTLHISHIAFGDLFLADIRAYREAQLQGTGIAPLFPLWMQPTAELARQMLAGGLRAILTCADPRRLPADFAGRPFDADLLGKLPADVDPCGEAGEFHTFVYDGPMFADPIAVRTGEITQRDGFVFADIQPVVHATTVRETTVQENGAT